MESIKDILIRRDNMSPDDADKLIRQAKDELFYYIEMGEIEQAENICETFFGLEPDYLIELFY